LHNTKNLAKISSFLFIVTAFPVCEAGDFCRGFYRGCLHFMAVFVAVAGVND